MRQLAELDLLGPIGPVTLDEIRLVLGERLGRNARFASIGNGIAAAAMGACGYYFSAHAVFFVTAALLVPTLVALNQIRPRDVDPDLAHGVVQS